MSDVDVYPRIPRYRSLILPNPVYANQSDAQMQQQQIQQVIEKLQGLPSEKLSEVEDFIDFLGQRHADHTLTRTAMAATEPTLHAIWDNADDAEYDRL